jgi:cyanate permease
MKHLLEFLKTPMAAPETAGLRAMRLTILACCTLLLPSMLLLTPLCAMLGNLAVGLIAGLIFALMMLVPVYARVKTRADDAHLSALAAGEGMAE